MMENAKILCPSQVHSKNAPDIQTHRVAWYDHISGSYSPHYHYNQDSVVHSDEPQLDNVVPHKSRRSRIKISINHSIHVWITMIQLKAISIYREINRQALV